ncbi:MAG: S9 family peptidase [Prevotellaceae bacterium]|jgi:dipeptidyl aminopeptidase/acylaminoacyl peptidase|nr:S9 family peptidase [Prevotellaceae bacterium]
MISCGGTDLNLIPLENFFKNPEKSSFQLSPDGKYLSYMAPVNSRMNIFVQEVGQTNATQLTHETERDVAGYMWANNNRILFLKDSGGDENYKLFGVDADGNNLKGLTDFDKVRTQLIDDLEDFEDEIIVGLNKRDPTIFDPYRLNVVTGELTQLAENPGTIQGWMTDHDGKLRVAVAMDVVDQILLYREKESDEFKPVLRTSFKETLSPMFFTFDNKYLYALSNIGRDKDAFIMFDPATGKEMEVLFEHPDYDIGGASYSRKRKELEGASWTGHQHIGRHYFSEEYKALRENLEAKLAGYQFDINSITKDENRIIVRTYTDKSLGAYYTYDKTTDELTKIADVSPWLNEADMSPMHCVTYKTRDGLTVEAYLTLPHGYTMETAKNLPVVVNPHGGPWARDTWGFNPEVQFLASRGYAVFQMNFRGSTGFGRNFWEISFKQWGLTMQDDITDGANWLIEQGIADKNRIAIYGGSYGGYATLAGLTYTPDLYTCGVDYVGVSNLFTFLKTIPPYWKPLLDMMYEMVGDPIADSLQLAQTSPALNADKIKAPLFIAQGANDPRVNKDESDQMVKALKDRGVNVEYMVKDNEGHGFHNEENRFDFYRAMEKFLAEHMQKNSSQATR